MHILYVFSQTVLSSLGLLPGDPELSGDFSWSSATSGIRQSGGGAGADAAPIALRRPAQQKFPVFLPFRSPGQAAYGRISAIDMNKGEVADRSRRDA